jgi:SAM-dependent methyltransferase
MFRYPRLNLNSYVELYNNEVTDIWAMRTLRKDQTLVKEYIERHSTAQNVMDFGCYAGHFLSALKPTLQKFGVEVNQSAAALARDKTNATVVPCLDQFAIEQRFDLIVAMDVIEHFESPSLLIRSLLARLSKNGRLLITTGDNRARLWRWVGARWWYSYFPEHIAFVSKPWVQHHAKDFCFKVVHCESFNYLDQSLLRQAKTAVGFLLYLIAPSIHAFLKRRKSVSLDEDSGVPGAGLSRDHLFIVLANNR